VTIFDEHAIVMYCSAGGIVLVFVQKKIYLFSAKSEKNIATRAALFGSNVQ